MKKYDCIIVGAGPTGIYCAYEFMLKRPDLKVLLIDKGNDIYQRKCPIIEKKLEKCPINAKGEIGCFPSCSMTTGFGGAGAFSDGKYNITNEYGGWMLEYMDISIVLELINHVDRINLEHGATAEITDPETEEVKSIEKKAIAVGLKLLRGKVRHIGTEQNINILKNIYKSMQSGIEYRFRSKVMNVIVESGKAKGVELETGEKIFSDNVVLGVGREGAMWLQNMLEKHNVTFRNNQVDIGVRVETNNIVMEEINKNLYEG